MTAFGNPISPRMTPLLDMHTHGHARHGGAVRIRNISSDFVHALGGAPVSMGLHPWHLADGDVERNFRALEAAAVHPEVLAIGECGLDRVCHTPMPLQEHWFRRQLAMAERLGKPVIVHCVRAFEEVLRILRDERVTVPVIFHGFRKGASLADRILAAGHRISFGQHLSQPKVSELFRSIPPERVFLETDDAEASIAEVYALAAVILDIEVAILAERLWANAVSVFGQHLNDHE